MPKNKKAKKAKKALKTKKQGQKMAKINTSQEFPKYLMKVDGQRKFLTFRDAYVMYDSGMHDVKFGRYVLNADFTVRKMKEEDRAKISESADNYSASK